MGETHHHHHHDNHHHHHHQQRCVILNALEDLGVHVLEPDNTTTSKSHKLAQALGAFATYCLEESLEETTLSILRQYEDDPSVGELQGGSDSASIYRISILDSDDNNDDSGGGAVADLFRAFRTVYPQYATILTVKRIKEYMLQMCNDPRRRQDDDDLNVRYSQLGNLMFILSTGPIPGQVRHIDHMDPNLQVCLYMSEHCPATVVYELEEPQTSSCITNCQELMDYWNESSYGKEKEGEKVPHLVQIVLTQLANVELANVPHLQYFQFWKTLNAHLRHFGKLYQRVAQRWAVTDCIPGTTLVARGNQVHAGPSCNIPRMFAFCIGIPDDDDDDDIENDNENMEFKNDNNNTNKEDQNGEIQYNPVLLHVDLCCIVFTTLDYDKDLYHNNNNSNNNNNKYDDSDTIRTAKLYLLHMLPEMIREYPQETYARLLGDDRAPLRNWLGELVVACRSTTESERITQLLETAASSSSSTTTSHTSNHNHNIFASPNVVVEGKKNLHRKRKNRKKKQQPQATKRMQ